MSDFKEKRFLGMSILDMIDKVIEAEKDLKEAKYKIENRENKIKRL